MYTDKNKPPELPYIPVHLKNAFLEDRVHDWDIVQGYFRYYSRISEGDIWILLELE